MDWKKHTIMSSGLGYSRTSISRMLNITLDNPTSDGTVDQAEPK
jgi:hypothetical protein